MRRGDRGRFSRSSELTFIPARSVPEIIASTSAPPSTSLVLQTIFLPLALADDPCEVMLIGGTHVPWSPSFHYLDLQWLPYLRRMGLEAEIELLLAGFYPQGNGQVFARIAPARSLSPLNLPDAARSADPRHLGCGKSRRLHRRTAEEPGDRAAQEQTQGYRNRSARSTGACEGDLSAAQRGVQAGQRLLRWAGRTGQARRTGRGRSVSVAGEVPGRHRCDG